jgi:hypothetical protein
MFLNLGNNSSLHGIFQDFSWKNNAILYLFIALALPRIYIPYYCLSTFYLQQIELKIKLDQDRNLHRFDRECYIN